MNNNDHLHDNDCKQHVINLDRVQVGLSDLQAAPALKDEPAVLNDLWNYARQTARARLPAMAPVYITTVIVEFARVLKPAAYLMRWTDKYVLCEGRHLGIASDLFKIVDLIATDNERIGMGYRTRHRGDFLLVMQRPPTKARATWSDHSIPDGWEGEAVRTIHPHCKPLGFLEPLIVATTMVGDYVIDPAAGGFGVMYAAHKLERNFIGCDAAYCGGSRHA